MKLCVDPYLFERLTGSVNHNVSESSVDEQTSADDNDEDSLQDLNIDLEVEQKDKFMALEDNMIENNFCHACGMKIDVQHGKEFHSSFERQVSTDDQYDINDKHIAEPAHQHNLSSYLEYKKIKINFDKHLTLVLQELENLNNSGNTNYKYVEKSIEWEHQISNVQKDALESSYDWHKRKNDLHSKLHILIDCLRDLQDSREYQLEAISQNDEMTFSLSFT